MYETLFRTNTCGDLNKNSVGQRVKLCGWIQRIRKMGYIIFIDLRDRYGITQLTIQRILNFEEFNKINQLGREFVISAIGTVAERTSKNPNISTGDIEIIIDSIDSIEILNKSKIPPFTIEDNTDGGEELRMKYRYLDLRRNVVKKNLELRHRMAILTRNYMNEQGFIEIETPVLIKSTPEGARDFVVPSRMNPGQFYALPQSPQTFKQLLMVAGFDRYFQIVKCFRDEDLRADRQPEFSQIDCEMSFVTQEDILNTFEGLAKYLFRKEKSIDPGEFPRMEYDTAMREYGSDKPDIRFGMKFVELDELVKGKGFKVFDEAELVAGINASGCAEYSRKQIDELTEWVKRPQVGASGLVYIRAGSDGTVKSSVDKFYTPDDLKLIASKFSAVPGDLILIMAGKKEKTQTALGALRLEMGKSLALWTQSVFKPLWVVNFPLLEWDEETKRFYAKHHPFTSPVPQDIPLLDTDPGAIRANAYDLVINGVEIGGGSIRIHNRGLQKKMFQVLGFTDELAQEQFGFLMNAFEYGAPPHGGIAFGFDRWCTIFGGGESIRDFMAFPKNNSGRDVMIDTPANISQEQLKELNIKLTNSEIAK
jgi:aspartyl-tRNA synthetase